MKNNITLATILLILFLISCKRENFEPDKYWGEASAIKNGSYWESFPSAGSSDSNEKFFVSFNTYGQQELHREELVISKIPLAIGTYNIKKTDSEMTDDKVVATLFISLYGGDVGGYFYNLSESADSLNSITVTKIKKDEIWGTFEVTLLRDTTQGKESIDFPDTLIFTDGKFHTKILE